MDIPQLLITIFCVLMLLPTIASISRFDQWWVRGFDFPRLQICFLIILAMSFAYFNYSFKPVWQFVLMILLGLSLIYQAIKIYPYTILAARQVKKYKGGDPETRFSVLISNVYAPNTHYEKLIARVRREQPDLLLTLESDKKWEHGLSELEEDYPYTVKVPQDNLYGMHLYSRLELEKVEVKYLITEEIPSIHGYFKLKSGNKIKFHCLHPKPPSPTEDSTSTNRDSELLMVGKYLRADREPIIVCGDLNDVAWSRTTRLFQKISGLLDPRIGRGFFNTYSTHFFFFRWPLDHIFHTKNISLVRIKRLKSIGSDHFPIFVKLNYEPKLEDEQGGPEKPDKEEKKWADKKIEKGKQSD